MCPGETAVKVERSVDLSSCAHLRAITSRGPSGFGGSGISHKYEFGFQIQAPEGCGQFHSILAPGFGPNADFYALRPGQRRTVAAYRRSRTVALKASAIVHEELRGEPRAENEVAFRTDLAGIFSPGRLVRTGITEIADIEGEIVGADTAGQSHPRHRLQLQFHVRGVRGFLHCVLQDGAGRCTLRLRSKADIGDAVVADLKP